MIQDLQKLAKAKYAEYKSSRAEKAVGKKVVNKAKEGLYGSIMGEKNYNKAVGTIKKYVKDRKPYEALAYGKEQREKIARQSR